MSPSAASRRWRWPAKDSSMGNDATDGGDGSGGSESGSGGSNGAAGSGLQVPIFIAAVGGGLCCLLFFIAAVVYVRRRKKDKRPNKRHSIKLKDDDELPKGWTMYIDESSGAVYENTKTGETRWGTRAGVVEILSYRQILSAKAKERLIQSRTRAQ